MSRGRRHARRNAEAVADSTVTEAAARWGLAAQGVLYLLVGLLALRIAFGDSGEAADQGGALRELAAQPFGRVLVWAVGIGLAGLALWRLSEALFGASEPHGRSPRKRLLAAGRCVFYGVVAYSVVSYALDRKGSGSSDARSQDVTARALSVPAGPWLVCVAGAVIACAGVWIAVQAVRRTFHKVLKLSALSHPVRGVIDVLGVCGGVARGVILAGAGVFAVQAAATADPDHAKGMDDTLRSFAQTPAGPWLLAAIALGLALFGLFSLALARWRHV